MNDNWGKMLRHAKMIAILPKDFWALSVKEWVMLNNNVSDAMPREVFSELMARFENNNFENGLSK